MSHSPMIGPDSPPMEEPILVSSSDEEDAAQAPALKRRQSLIPSIVIDLENEPDTAENTAINIMLGNDHLALNLQRQLSKHAEPHFDLAMARQQSFEREAADVDNDSPPPPPSTPPLPPPALAPQPEPQRPPLDAAAAAGGPQPLPLPLSRRVAVDTAAQKAALRAARRKGKAKATGGDFAENFFAALNAERQPRLEQERERYARWLKQQEEEEAERRREAATRDLLWEQRRALTTFLNRKADSLRIREVWSNPESFPGGRLYERFREAWEAVPQSGLRMCFHGTNEANIAAICHDGLDPARRAGQAMGPGEYFGGHAHVSLGYCKGGRKMLVFCVLTHKSGLTANTDAVLVVNKPEHQLPIAVVTFDGAGGARHDDPARGAGHVLGGVQAVSAVGGGRAAEAEPIVDDKAAQEGKWGRGALRKAQRHGEAGRKRGGGSAGRKRSGAEAAAARGGRDLGGDGGAGGGAKHVRVEAPGPRATAVDDEDAELQEALRRSMVER